MNEFEENILKKVDDISEILIEKFALKKETIKALKFIEERIENIEKESGRWFYFFIINFYIIIIL